MLSYTKDHRLSVTRKLSINLWLAFTYVLAANMSSFFTNYFEVPSPVWPPSGIALALALILGFRHIILGISLGVILSGYTNSWPLSGTLGVLGGSLLEPILSTIIIQIINKGRFSFKRPSDIFYFIIVGAIFSPLVCNFFNSHALNWAGIITPNKVQDFWMEWAVGNSLGVLIFMPFTWRFFHKTSRVINYLEGLVLYSLLTICSIWAFGDDWGRTVFLIPFTTWAALRFSYMGVSIASLFLGIVGTWKTVIILRPLDTNLTHEYTLWLQLFIAAVTVAGYFLATIMEADERIEEKEMELSINRKRNKIAEDALDILDQTLNRSPIGFALIDKNFKFIRINGALADINDIPANMYLGKTISEVLPQYASSIETNVSKVLESGESFTVLMKCPKKDSHLLEVLVSYYPIRYPSSYEIFGVGISMQDLSEQLRTAKLLEENQVRFNFAQDAAQIGAFEWDVKTDKFLASPQFEAIYGVSSMNALKDWEKWIHPEDIVRVKSFIQETIFTEREFSIHYRIINQDKELKWILARGKTFCDPLTGNLRMIGINIDVTEQKDIEHKLRLTEANLLHALNTRDEFMAIASHELKTPLTSLKLQNQLYQKKVKNREMTSLDPVKLSALLEKNTRQIDRLTRLVDDMLDISRINTGKLTLKKEVGELKSILEDVLNRLEEQFIGSGSGIPRVLCMDQVTGEWDLMRLEQVMVNILSNAIRYGRGQPISVALKNLPGHVLLEVKDQGQGITKSDQEKIFNRFERGLLAREISGLGLGLYISKQIIEAHGGKIWVESQINSGSTFHVTIPKISFPNLEENLSLVSPASLLETETT